MKSFKALSKQFFGARYEQIPKSIIISGILFFALHTAEIRFVIAPFILYLTATAFPVGIMWQMLCSSKNAETMAGLFMLPFHSRRFTFAYTFAFSTYTFLTKTLLVLMPFYAVGDFAPTQIVFSLICTCNACLMAAVIFVMMGQKRTLLGLIWAAATVASIFIFKESVIIFYVVLADTGIAVVYLFTVNPYLFYRSNSNSKLFIHKSKKGKVFSYLLRYLFTNKTYLVNTLGLWLIAAFMPLLFGQLQGLNAMPLGFAMITLNTPICVLLSCDPDLEQALRVLPKQVLNFCVRYCLFIFLVNLTASGIYLCSWQIQIGGLAWDNIMTAFLFSFQSAILSVLLERLHPIRNWMVESDLWHNPRKYIVPLIMILLSVIVATFEAAVWIWLCVFPVECCTLILVAKRI